MKHLIIGSTAMKHWFGDDFNREPKDLDIVVNSSRGYKSTKGVEYLENPVILKYQKTGYLKPDLLLTLKMSHMFWDFNWKKHMWDIQFLIDRGYKHDPKIMKELVAYWEETKPKIRRSNLDMSAKDFFSNAVNKDEHEHDFLHTLINPVPMYTRLLRDGCEVELDKRKWDALNHQEKYDVVFEETAVMAYERYKKSYYKAGYERQLEQNIIKHFPKYIAEFAILNYKEVVKPKFNFINTIKNGLQKNQ